MVKIRILQQAMIPQCCGCGERKTAVQRAAVSFPIFPFEAKKSSISLVLAKQ